MDDAFGVSRSDLEAVLNPIPGQTSQREVWVRLRAALAPPEPPWGPSDADIDAWCEATGFGGYHHRTEAKLLLLDAHERGWDAVPRRLSPELHRRNR